jgi:hypothetical protein
MSPASNQQQERVNTLAFSTNLRQIYVSTWSGVCMACMIIVAGIFLMQRGSDQVCPWTSGMRQIPHPSMHQSLSGGQMRPLLPSLHMSKNTAMVLVFVHTGAAWLMSNGIVMNPRQNGFSRIAATH